MSCSDGIILLYVVHSVVQLPEAEFLDESLQSYPPCYLKNSTSTALPRDLYFFKLAQPLTVSTGDRIRRKSDRKPYPPSLRFKKSIQKPHVRELSRNLNEIVHCTFMNSASGQPVSGSQLGWTAEPLYRWGQGVYTFSVFVHLYSRNYSNKSLSYYIFPFLVVSCNNIIK